MTFYRNEIACPKETGDKKVERKKITYVHTALFPTLEKPLSYAIKICDAPNDNTVLFETTLET